MLIPEHMPSSADVYKGVWLKGKRLIMLPAPLTKRSPSSAFCDHSNVNSSFSHIFMSTSFIDDFYTTLEHNFSYPLLDEELQKKGWLSVSVLFRRQERQRIDKITIHRCSWSNHIISVSAPRESVIYINSADYCDVLKHRWRLRVSFGTIRSVRKNH